MADSNGNNNIGCGGLFWIAFYSWLLGACAMSTMAGDPQAVDAWPWWMHLIAILVGWLAWQAIWLVIAFFAAIFGRR